MDEEGETLTLKLFQMGIYKIAVLVGSLRKESYNLKMAKALIELAPSSLALELVSIGTIQKKQ